ncbi:Nuclear pore complex protein NUP58-like protein [Drosera capensis]
MSLFGTPQQQQPLQSIFSFSQNPQQQQQQSQLGGSIFGQQHQPQQQMNAFSMYQQQQQQQQQQQGQQQLFLMTKEKTPVSSYGTKWEDLHPDSQKSLLLIEERILEYRDESQRLDQCSRLFDSSVSNDAFELDAAHIVQELGGINTTMERQKAVLVELMSTVKDMLRNTEVAVRSFIMLRPRFLRPKAGATSTATLASKTSGAITAANASGQPAADAVVPVFDFYCGIPKKPSPFFTYTVARFEKCLVECRQLVEELEQLLVFDSDRNAASSHTSLLQSLPEVISNVHDFFVHVAAKVESIHQYIESMKTAYLADQRRRGEGNDPFLEADRRETARQEAAARRVHATLHLPALPQPSAQVPALPAPSANQAAPANPQMTGSSLFSTPFSTPLPTTSPSLFSTPVPTVPATSLFPSSSPSPQTSLFSPSPATGFGSASSLFSSTGFATSFPSVSTLIMKMNRVLKNSPEAYAMVFTHVMKVLQQDPGQALETQQKQGKNLVPLADELLGGENG